MASPAIDLPSNSRIAVDLDDVLASSVKAIIDYSNVRWGTQLTMGDYDDYWAKMWGIHPDEAFKRGEELYSHEFMGTIAHDETALNHLQDLADKFELVILTSRKAKTKDITLTWLDRFFPGVFSDVHFAGIWDDITVVDRHKLTKAEAMNKIGAQLLIDDQPKHCIGVAESGVPTILFGDYPWNFAVEPTQNMQRAKDWQEIKTLLLA